MKNLTKHRVLHELRHAKAEPQAVWHYFVVSLLGYGCKFMIAVPLAYLVFAIAHSRGTSWWLALLFGFITANVILFRTSFLLLLEPGRMGEAWREIEHQEIPDRVALAMIELQFRTLVRCITYFAMSLVIAATAGIVLFPTWGYWSILSSLVTANFMFGALSHSAEDAAKRFSVGLSDLKDEAIMPVVRPAGGLRLPYSVCDSAPQRVLLMPNLSLVSLLSHWKIVSSVIGLTGAVAAIRFFEVKDFFVFPTIFGISFLAVLALTKFVFRARYMHFQILCFRRFNEDSGRIFRSTISPLMGCYGTVHVVTDERMERSPGYMDLFAQSGEHDPMRFLVALPDHVIGATNTYSLSDKNWIDNVLTLIKNSDLVISDVSAGLSPNVLFELQQASLHLPGSRIVILSRTQDHIDALLGSAFGLEGRQPVCILYTDSFLGKLRLKRRLKQFMSALQ